MPVGHDSLAGVSSLRTGARVVAVPVACTALLASAALLLCYWHLRSLSHVHDAMRSHLGSLATILTDSTAVRTALQGPLAVPSMAVQLVGIISVISVLTRSGQNTCDKWNPTQPNSAVG